MRTPLEILALAALLCSSPQPAPSGGGRTVRAADSETELPVRRERAQRLTRRVEEAQQRFRAALADLDRLDVPQAAWELDRELCSIVDEGLALEGAGRGRDSALEDLVEVALGDVRRARARMEAVESLGSTAHSYLRLLREMRTARQRGDLAGVLALYRERRSDSLPEQWAQPVRRVLEALDGLRVEVALEHQALMLPR